MYRRFLRFGGLRLGVRLAGPEITEYGEIGRGDKKIQFVEFLTGDAQAARHGLEQKVDGRCVDRNRGK